MALVDNAILRGRPPLRSQGLDETYEGLRARYGLACIGLYRPALSGSSRTMRCSLTEASLVLAAGGNCFGQFGFVADRL